MASIPNRRDPRWTDPAWRTDNLLALIADFQLTSHELVELTGRELTTVLHWRSGRHKVIPLHSLRLLWLELALEGRDALR